jgi:valyl-tRNA synthetase
MNVYKLFWDEFSGWYLEAVKPDYEKPVDRVTYEATAEIFDSLVRLLHPFMPFITEEIWQMLAERKPGESIMISPAPPVKRFNKELIARFEVVKETVSAIRTVRKEKNLPNKEKIDLLIKSAEKDFDSEFLPVIKKLCNLAGVEFVSEKQNGAASFMVGTTEFFIPLGEKLDIKGELTRIAEEISYQKGFLESVMKKLGNDRFVQNAPASVIELERRKKADAESKIESLTARQKELKG